MARDCDHDRDDVPERPDGVAEPDFLIQVVDMLNARMKLERAAGVINHDVWVDEDDARVRGTAHLLSADDTDGLTAALSETGLSLDGEPTPTDAGGVDVAFSGDGVDSEGDE